MFSDIFTGERKKKKGISVWMVVPWKSLFSEKKKKKNVFSPFRAADIFACEKKFEIADMLLTRKLILARYTGSEWTLKPRSIPIERNPINANIFSDSICSLLMVIVGKKRRKKILIGRISLYRKLYVVYYTRKERKKFRKHVIFLYSPRSVTKTCSPRIANYAYK